MSDSSSAGQMIKFLCEVGKLKHSPRRGWVHQNIPQPETISGHMYRMAVVSLICLQSIEEINLDKVLKLSLVHDIAECIVGDIIPSDNISKEKKHEQELAAIKSLCELLPNGRAHVLESLFNEYEDQETPEAKLTKDLDRFDMVLQAFQYEKSETERNGKLAILADFFHEDRVLNHIQNPQIKALIDEILKQRKDFQAKRASNSS
ncbi:5'-deoxynucleotidase HDDC2-like [Brevipalpus obovatus]|uniref:5'-deoxynucleotidase HDDC2-like n=1 Tax=Brevipalpus obovatus TaxID=246614 RepID=UPI003D9F751F